MDELISLIKRSVDVNVPIDADTPLLSSGIIDSFGVVVVIANLEEHYSLTLDESSIDVRNFDTPRQILGVITSSRPTR